MADSSIHEKEKKRRKKEKQITIIFMTISREFPQTYCRFLKGNVTLDYRNVYFQNEIIKIYYHIHSVNK